MSPGALPSWFSSWCVVSIDTGCIAHSPQSGPEWSPAFKMEPVLFPPSLALYANKSRNKLLGQGRMTLFRKPADQKDDGLRPRRILFPELGFRLFSYQKGRESSQPFPGSNQTQKGCVPFFLPAATHPWA